MDIVVMCNICMTEGRFVQMGLENGFLICPECTTETWTKDSFIQKFEMQQREKRRAENTYVSLSLPEGVKVPGGDKKSGKLPDKMKKQPLSTLNKKLYDGA